MDHPTPATRLATGHRHPGQRSVQWRSAVAVLGAAVLATTAGPGLGDDGRDHPLRRDPARTGPEPVHRGTWHLRRDIQRRLPHQQQCRRHGAPRRHRPWHGNLRPHGSGPGVLHRLVHRPRRPERAPRADHHVHRNVVDTLTGSDGSKIQDRGMFHITSHPDGSVSSSLDRFTLTCP
jgi:hypothetical protein